MDIIEKFYVDDCMVYVFIVDYGMSDYGSYGDGYFDNIRILFISWGFGVVIF